MAAVVDNVQVIYGNDDGTDTTWSFTAPTAGDQIIAAIVRGNGPVTVPPVRV